MAVTVDVQCDRIDCDRSESVEVDVLDRAASVESQWPQGWGWDRHDGINAAFHCPDHRRAPTPDEVAEIMRHAKAEGRLD